MNYVRLWHLRDLVTDPLTGKLSHHKLWSNIGYGTTTVAFAKIAWLAQPSDALSMLFLVYLGTVGGSVIAHKFVDLKLANAALAANGNGVSHPPEKGTE